MQLRDKRILITGPTSQAAAPITTALAADNDVTAVARFTDTEQKSWLETLGIRCISLDISRDRLDSLPGDVDYVLNFAMVRTNDWDGDITANAEAAGLLMDHCRRAEAFLHCSSTAVYHPAGTHPLVETDALGENHRDFMPTYSLTKVATEAVVRTEARRLGLPTTIARLNVPYGNHGGWPAWHLECILGGFPIDAHPDAPSLFNPIHSDDMIAMIPGLLKAASVPATIVNWAGDEQVGLEEWCLHLGGLVDRQPSFNSTTATVGSVTTDNTKRMNLVGPTTVNWRGGMVAMVSALHPEIEIAEVATSNTAGYEQSGEPGTGA